MASLTHLSRLPVIDLALFEAGDPWREQLAAELDWASRTFGAFVVVGHGIDAAPAESLLASGRRLSSVKSSELRAARAREDSVDQDSAREYATALTGLGHKLVATLGRALGLGAHYFVDHLTGQPTVQLRVAALPAGLLNDDVGSAANGGLLTIRKLDTGGGLEIENAGRWLDVPEAPDALLVSLGSAFTQLTDGRYRSALHRVRDGLIGKLLTLRFRFDGAVPALSADEARPNRSSAAREVANDAPNFPSSPQRPSSEVLQREYFQRLPAVSRSFHL